MATGVPELKEIPACLPKYHILNSPWEKHPMDSIVKNKILIKTFIIQLFMKAFLNVEISGSGNKLPKIRDIQFPFNV
jgi:hypothetical protein